MSGCEEEASAIAYARNDLVNEILEYINNYYCHHCDRCDYMTDNICPVVNIKNYINSLKEE